LVLIQKLIVAEAESQRSLLWLWLKFRDGAEKSWREMAALRRWRQWQQQAALWEMKSVDVSQLWTCGAAGRVLNSSAVILCTLGTHVIS
jgi:hypothetical protein